ncbi:type II toxin-antitoxin system RelB family antitoxin [Levilactobacillus yiduensis]|uniref:type II toxin-antitoxin system RelB family antitoxin n=1 Tax=Levilactobacillus yiduensis TaxID=2953880 RepID=UPI000EF2D649|nr:DUF6290 family protein [Levilactobacillus yiduensis]AYM02327.1 hypothetical protein D8911_04700 [Levilactobacillus brevis]
MTVTSLRFKDDQYQEVKALADFYGESVTTFMRRTILERLEDEADYRDAVSNLQTSHGETVSRQEVMQRLGLK